MISSIRCEVLVVGGGPAGTLVATMLARGGADVLQAVGAPERSSRPDELLSPSARRLLARHGLWEPDNAATCDGVLSLWEEGEPQFHDYGLTACQVGLSVDRCGFHENLLHSARQAHFRVLQPARLRRRQQGRRAPGDFELQADDKAWSVTTKWVIDASGRSGAACAPAGICRQPLGRLVALAVPFRAARNRRFLTLEATRDGWWYVPPSAKAVTQLVFVTDPDLLPKGLARQHWLLAQFRSTRLISNACEHEPSFAKVRGVNAHFAAASPPVADGWAAIGDAALSLDPLSGNGIWIALRGAEQAAGEILRSGRIGPVYSEWVRRTLDEEQAMRRSVYERASRRFPDSAFWQRNREVRPQPT